MPNPVLNDVSSSIKPKGSQNSVGRQCVISLATRAESRRLWTTLCRPKRLKLAFSPEAVQAGYCYTVVWQPTKDRNIGNKQPAAEWASSAWKVLNGQRREAIKMAGVMPARCSGLGLTCASLVPGRAGSTTSSLSEPARPPAYPRRLAGLQAVYKALAGGTELQGHSVGMLLRFMCCCCFAQVTSTMQCPRRWACGRMTHLRGKLVVVGRACDQAPTQHTALRAEGVS